MSRASWGLGPLVAINEGFKVIRFEDIERRASPAYKRGECQIKHISTETISAAVPSGHFRASSDFSEISSPGACRCSHTAQKIPRAGPMFDEMSTRAVAKMLRPGQLVVLQSTTWPGTTAQMLSVRCGIDLGRFGIGWAVKVRI